MTPKVFAIGIAITTAFVLGGCATTPPPAVPTLAQMQPPPSPPKTPPKITGQMILARYPKEIQESIRKYAEGDYPTWTDGYGNTFVPYADRMQPIPVQCSPNHHVDIYVDGPGAPSEQVTGVAAGDPERWKIGPVTSNIVYVGCKDDVDDQHKPLSSDASIFTSDGDTIPLVLNAKPRTTQKWIRLYYPELIVAQMQAADAAPPPTAQEMDPVAPADTAVLNCAYRIEGKEPWAPSKVCDDGTHTRFQMPHTPNPVSPVLLGDKGAQIEARQRGDMLVADGLYSRMQLVVGNDKVTVERMQ